MCYGAETVWISAALAAAGAATSAYASSQQLKKQDQIAAAGIIKQGQLQKQGEADVSNTIGQVAQSNAKTAAKSNDQLAQYRAALQQGSGISGTASPNVPGSSKAYKAAQTTAGAGASDYVNKIATGAATTEGTQLERVGENEQMGDTAGKLGMLQGQAQNENYLTKLRVQSTQANPWLQGLGALMSAAGSTTPIGAGISAAGAGAQLRSKKYSGSGPADYSSAYNDGQGGSGGSV